MEPVSTSKPVEEEVKDYRMWFVEKFVRPYIEDKNLREATFGKFERAYSINKRVTPYSKDGKGNTQAQVKISEEILAKAVSNDIYLM